MEAYRHLKDAEELFSAGADKVLINSNAYSNPNLITQITDVAVSQAVVIGIDVLTKTENEYELYSESSLKYENVTLSEHINKVRSHGAGEIMIQSINQDGMMSGYDLNLLKKTCSFSSVPVIAAGGAGSFNHLLDALNTGVDAVACGSMFNFGDNNPLRAKAFLNNYDIPLKTI